MNKRFLVGLAIVFLLFGMFGVANATTIVDVYAYDHSSNAGNSNGLNTGVTLSVGDILSINVDYFDTWSAGSSPRTSNANGLDVNSIQFGGYNFGYYTAGGSTFFYGSLIGRIGATGNRFFVGTSFSGPVTDSGILYLMYWDSNYFDNTGYVTASIDKNSPVPEPSTMLLLGFGLVGLAGVTRKKTNK